MWSAYYLTRACDSGMGCREAGAHPASRADLAEGERTDCVAEAASLEHGHEQETRFCAIRDCFCVSARRRQPDHGLSTGTLLSIVLDLSVGVCTVYLPADDDHVLVYQQAWLSSFLLACMLGVSPFYPPVDDVPIIICSKAHF